ncbi:hypothetical protein [Terrabacter sp. 2YAF2]|uniref:hypothetical protein n=1 Tax=Terrabacter sp. 2YAF2 TaxID=3233026 RepID=UPI003F94E8B7
MTAMHPRRRPDSAVRERWVAPRRGLIGALSLGGAAGWGSVWVLQAGHVQPLHRAAAAVLAVGYVVGAVGTLRKEVLLDDGGLVIVRGFRRTRISWTEVRELRVRGLGMGGGWIEAVRQDGRETVVPAPVEAFSAMRSSWQRAAGARP